MTTNDYTPWEVRNVTYPFPRPDRTGRPSMIVDETLRAVESVIRSDPGIFWSDRHADCEHNDLDESDIYKPSVTTHILLLENSPANTSGFFKFVCEVHGLPRELNETMRRAHQKGAENLLPEVNTLQAHPVVTWSPCVHECIRWGLSLQQARIFIRVLDGQRISDIATSLGISKGAVRSHRQRIRDKNEKSELRFDESNMIKLIEGEGLHEYNLETDSSTEQFNSDVQMELTEPILKRQVK